MLRSIIALGAIAALVVGAPLQENNQQITLSRSKVHSLDDGAQLNFKKDGLRLIETSATERKWMTEAEIMELWRAGKGFMDVTEFDLAKISSLAPVKHQPPTNVTHQDLVKPLLDNISEAAMEKFLAKFTSFPNRYFKSPNGKKSSDWLYWQLKWLLWRHPSKHYKATVRQVKNDFPQTSTVVRIVPVAKDRSYEDVPIVIVGAHQDSANYKEPMTGRAPGADDDGSGSATIFEALRVLLESKVLDTEKGWSKPIEYHWYAAEEGGLLGSLKVAADYKERGVDVYAMWQCDMTGYVPPNTEEVIGVVIDSVDDGFTEYAKQLIETYNSIGWAETSLGKYAGSDHMSWHQAGYSAIFTFESIFEQSNPHIHTPDDDLPYISFKHMAEFAKTIIGWTIELTFD